VKKIIKGVEMSKKIMIVMQALVRAYKKSRNKSGFLFYFNSDD